MTLHRITILTSCLTLSVLGTACDLGDKSLGNDTGADQGDPGETGETGVGDDNDDDNETGFGDDCGDAVVSVVDDLDAAQPGFTGSVNDYLALIEGSYLGEFAWLPEDGPVTNEHAGTQSPLTLTVTYAGGEVRLHEVELVGQPPEDGFEDGLCSNVLEIDVTLGFTTADGLFAEAFAIPVRVYSHSDISLANFYFSLDMDSLQGQLSLDDFVVNDGSVSDLVLIGDLDGETVDGSLNIEIMAMDWVGFGNIAGFQATRAP